MRQFRSYNGRKLTLPQTKPGVSDCWQMDMGRCPLLCQASRALSFHFITYFPHLFLLEKVVEEQQAPAEIICHVFCLFPAGCRYNSGGHCCCLAAPLCQQNHSEVAQLGCSFCTPHWGRGWGRCTDLCVRRNISAVAERCGGQPAAWLGLTWPQVELSPCSQCKEKSLW